MTVSDVPNPWLQVSAEDYERHMNSPEVDQLSLLSRVFGDALGEFDCSLLAVIGAATGNGFEMIDNSRTKEVTAIDINPVYLEILQSRYQNRINKLRLLNADIESLELPDCSFTLIFGGLIFEYVSLLLVLPKLFNWLKPGGTLAAVLQLRSDTKDVITQTGITGLNALSTIMHLCDVESFEKDAAATGFSMVKKDFISSSAGKEFCFICFQKT